MQALLDNQIIRFLLLGGLAAAINWLARFPLSLVMPLSAAVLVAYMIGMSAGFYLYRVYVFPGSDRPITQQIVVFLLVNLVGAIVVLTLTLALLKLQSGFALHHTLKEGLAHGLAIGIGAVVNFFGHKLLTFSVARKHLDQT